MLHLLYLPFVLFYDIKSGKSNGQQAVYSKDNVELVPEAPENVILSTTQGELKLSPSIK